MRKVFKYPLTGPETILDLPKGAVVLKVGAQSDSHGPCLWVLVEPSAETEWRAFYVYGTGHWVMPGGVIHVGSWFESNGALVWHCFERAVLQDQRRG